MTEKQVLDNSGNILTVLDVDDTWFPRTFDIDTLRNIPNIPLRNDDIFLCGCPRSGHHWVYEIINMILSGSTEYLAHNMESRVLELTPISSLQTLPSPRILTTHVLPYKLPTDHIKKKLKTIYVIRDPKDVAVSWFHFYQAYPGDSYEGSWDDWLDLFLREKFMWSNWFDHVLSFEMFFSSMDPSLYHVVFYEDLKQNPLQEIKKLASFLERSASEETLVDIVSKCTFENMKQESYKDNLEWYHGKIVQYRKGIVGDWRSLFTKTQEEKFNKVYRKKLEGSAVKIRYEENTDYINHIKI